MSNNTLPPLTATEVEKIFRADQHIDSAVQVSVYPEGEGIWSVIRKGQLGGTVSLIGPDGTVLIVSCPTGSGYQECFDKHIQHYKEGKRLSWDEHTKNL